MHALRVFSAIVLAILFLELSHHPTLGDKPTKIISISTFAVMENDFMYIKRQKLCFETW